MRMGMGFGGCGKRWIAFAAVFQVVDDHGDSWDSQPLLVKGDTGKGDRDLTGPKAPLITARCGGLEGLLS